mgnify:CR=1 FL=1
MGTKRKFHDLGGTDPKPIPTPQSVALLAQFASAIVASGEKNPKEVFDRAEKLLEELRKRTM